MKYKKVKAVKRTKSKEIEASEKENEVKASYTFMAAEAMRFNETLTVREAAKMFNITPESLHGFLKRRQILEAEYNPELKKTKLTTGDP
jgi:phage antirepressor YoqD-like protein